MHKKLCSMQRVLCTHIDKSEDILKTELMIMYMEFIKVFDWPCLEFSWNESMVTSDMYIGHKPQSRKEMGRHKHV